MGPAVSRAFSSAALPPSGNSRLSGFALADTLSFADGRQRNRGLEWSVTGQLRAGLRVLGGASWTQATLTRTAGGVNQGKQAVATPRWQARRWIFESLFAICPFALRGPSCPRAFAFTARL